MTLLAAIFAAVLLVKACRHHRRRTAGALLAVAAVLGFTSALGVPALAQGDDCAEAPMPEVPGEGMVGAIDPPEGQGEAGSPYADYGYAGMVWHTYNTDCGPLSTSFTSPSTTLDTWLGNQLFDTAKTLVAATNALHYTLMDGGLLTGLTDPIKQAAEAVFGNVYTQLVSLALLILAIALLRLAWQGALTTVSRRGLVTLAALGVAASATALVASYPVIDDLIITATTGAQAGIVDLDDDRIARDALPTDLHNTVVYNSWLRGEFGDPDHPKAHEHGCQLLNDAPAPSAANCQLLDAQAFTEDQTRRSENSNPAAVQAKRDQYKQVSTDLGSAIGYFTGEEGSRTGVGFLALLQALAYTVFPLLAKIGVLLAQVLLRIATLAAPFIGLAALIHPDTLRKTGKALGATTLTVLTLAILAGIHTRLLQLLWTPAARLPLLAHITLALLTTVIFLVVARPIRRIRQMITLARDAVLPVAARGTRLGQAHTTAGSTAHDNFWQQLTPKNPDQVPRSRRSQDLIRPEARLALPEGQQNTSPPGGFAFVIASRLRPHATTGAPAGHASPPPATAHAVDQLQPTSSTGGGNGTGRLPPTGGQLPPADPPHGERPEVERDLAQIRELEQAIATFRELEEQVFEPHLAKLRNEGHGPQRHLTPTDDQLKARLGKAEKDANGNPLLNPLTGNVIATGHIDPMTKTTTDGVHPKRSHRCGSVSSAFIHASDFVKAEKYLRAKAIADNEFAPEGNIEDILGRGAETRLRGYRHSSTKAGDYDEVDFTGGTIFALYARDAQGGLKHITMYPEPRQP